MADTEIAELPGSPESPEPDPPSRGPRGPIAWMTHNSVASNLLMFVLVVAGIVGALSTKQEVFPEFSTDKVSVTVAYPGASPKEVEQGIVLAVEERVRGIDGVKRVNATAREGSGTVTVDLLLDADPETVLADVKNEVDRITTFPEEAEAPTVALAKNRRQVISLVLAGDQELATLHEIAEKVRADLLANEEITSLELDGVPPLEVSVEIPRQTLRKYGLSLQQIAGEVSASSLELPGGELETPRGEINVRVADRKREGHELRDVIVSRTAQGADVSLGEIATITDGYEDIDREALFDGKPAVRVTVYRVGDQTPASVAKAVHEYAETLRAELPDNIDVAVWQDDSEILEQRMDLLLENAALGLVLVVVILALFLDLRLAFWVALGIPISFLGSFVVLGSTDFSINMITLFAFIVTLGMVVDDAIVVGERTFALREKGLSAVDASIAAAREMVVPVTFAILTTVAAFSPLFFVPGTMGKIFKLIPAVVVSVLVLSLLESFFVLPAHLAHSKAGDDKPLKPWWQTPLASLQRAVAAGLQFFIHRIYRPLLEAAVRNRYLTLGASVAVLILTIGYVASGRVPFNFFPPIEGDVVRAQARLPYGSPLEETERVRGLLEQAADDALAELGDPDDRRGMYTRVGEEAPQMGPGGGDPEQGSHIVEVEINLVPVDDRPFGAEAYAAAWQKHTPEIAGLESMSFNAAMGPSAGAAVALQLGHVDDEVLARASDELTAILREYSELKNVRNGWAEGKPQLDFHLRPQARALGLTSTEVARQIRASFHGAEAIREQRDRNEVKVVVRLPRSQRVSEHAIEALRIRTPAGGWVPLAYVATYERTKAATSINREDGRRQVTVSAELAPGVESSREVLADLEKNVYDELEEKFPGLTIAMVGQQREQKEAFVALGKNYAVALFVIFGLLAVPFRSYVQPVIVMAVIPFGFVGAIAGHMLMGISLSIMSMFGLVALSGVVVNDSLVLIDASNRVRATGKDAHDSIVEAGMTRLRPILLTSLTTFFGLVPMITETSVQAQFLIPMAVSLGFGVLLVTVIALVVVPAFYLIAEDVRGLFNRR